MSGIEVLTLIAVVVFAGFVALVAVVTIGIRHEERVFTLLRRKAPGLESHVARRVLGLYVRKTEPEPVRRIDPEQPVPTYERCA